MRDQKREKIESGKDRGGEKERGETEEREKVREDREGNRKTEKER